MNENVVINIIAKSDKFKSEADKTAEKLDKIKRAAYSANLSLMFAGMAMQRMAQTVINFGTKAYDDISHSIVGTVTANDRLQGSMVMLGFTVGEAIAPILDALIPVIEAMTNWIELHPELMANITALALVLGTAAAVSGGFGLAKSSLGSIVDAIKAIPTNAKEAKDFNWSELGKSISSGIGMVAIGFGFVNVVEAVDELVKGKDNSISSLFQLMGGVVQIGAGGMLIKGKSGGWLMLAVGMALDAESKDSLLTDILGLVGIVTGLLALIGWALAHTIQATINGITSFAIDALTTTANKISPGYYSDKEIADMKAGSSVDLKIGSAKDVFGKSYNELLQAGKEIDAWIKDAKDSATGANQVTSSLSGPTNNPNGSPTLTGYMTQQNFPIQIELTVKNESTGNSQLYNFVTGSSNSSQPVRISGV